MDKAIVVVTGDLHVNSTVALCPPAVQLDDGGTYRASPVQRYIWRKWQAFWNEVQETKDRLQWPVFVILNGELADDNHHNTTELITRNPSDQMRNAVRALEPALNIADHIIVTRGTEAHVGASAWMDEKIAQDIGAIPDGEKASWYRWRGKIAGTLFDVAHHPGTGHRLHWTRGADAIRLAAGISFSYAELGLKVPDLTIRGHNHKPSDSGHNHATHAIILPSWQLSTSFGYRLGGDFLPIGGAWFLCETGKPPVWIDRRWDWITTNDKIWTPNDLPTTNS